MNTDAFAGNRLRIRCLADDRRGGLGLDEARADGMWAVGAAADFSLKEKMKRQPPLTKW